MNGKTHNASTIDGDFTPNPLAHFSLLLLLLLLFPLLLFLLFLLFPFLIPFLFLILLFCRQLPPASPPPAAAPTMT